MPFSKRFNYFLAVLPVLIFSLGFITHLSTSSERAYTQLIFFIISYGLFWLVSFIDYRLLGYIHKPLYWISIGSLLLVFVLGKTVLGSVRWLSVGVLTFQPSEFAKFALVLFIAFYLDKNKHALEEPKNIARLVFMVLPLVILVFIQPDLGSSLILSGLTAGMLFVAGLNWIYFVVSAGLFGALSTPLWHLLREYQKHRILVFLNPSSDVLGKGYNVVQSLISIGSGELLGKGYGRGSQSHLNFLPIFWTDFVFAAFAEEWGFLGVAVLLALYFLLLLTLLLCIVKASDRLGAIIASGVFSIFFCQFVINIGMNLGLLPVTGVPLPLVSYGGSSIIVSGILLGLAHSVWLYRQSRS